MTSRKFLFLSPRLESEQRSDRLEALTLALAGTLLALPLAAQADPLPYSNRSQDYSAWTAATRGDITTVGMAGATLAVPSSIAGAEANSAGYAMEMPSLSVQINSVTLHDQAVQRTGQSFTSGQFGVGVSAAPWGFGIAYYSPLTESGTFDVAGRKLPMEVSLKEFRFTVARSFLESRLALGFSVGLEKAVREFGPTDFNSWGFGAHLGALYRLEDHVFLGASYVPEMHLDPSGISGSVPGLTGLDRGVWLPAQIGLGVGWRPNRFFKGGFSLNYVAPTRNTALLADQSIATGLNPTWIPRLGASYVIAEFNKWRLEGAAGTYYEPSRLSDEANRLHGTGELEAEIYFADVGLGVDAAANYRNVLVSVGVNVVSLMRTFKLIPADSVPAYSGFFPPIDRISADGLPGAMTTGEKKNYKEPSLQEMQKIVSEIPKKIETTLNGGKTPAPIPVPGAPAAKKKKPRRRKKAPHAVTPEAPASTPATADAPAKQDASAPTAKPGAAAPATASPSAGTPEKTPRPQEGRNSGELNLSN